MQMAVTSMRLPLRVWTASASTPVRRSFHPILHCPVFVFRPAPLRRRSCGAWRLPAHPDVVRQRGCPTSGEGAAHHDSRYRDHHQQEQDDVLPSHPGEAAAKTGEEIVI